MNHRQLTILLLAFTLNALGQPKAPQYLISAPAGNAYTQIVKAGRTVLPNGRFITPRGRQIETAPHPYGLALSPDGNTVITANSGINPFSISIIRDALGTSPTVRQVPDGPKTDNGILEACFMGLAVSPDGKTVYVAGGETNKIFLFDLATGKPAGSINCGTKTAASDYRHGYIGDMALTRDGKTLYAVDQIGFRLVVIDVPSNTIRHNVPTGRYPFGITLSPDEKTAYVANVGVFEYKPFTDLNRKDLKRTAHEYPSSKYGSKEMRDGDAKRGIPALGDPNVPEAFSVWRIDLAGSPTTPAQAGQAVPAVTAKVKTGFLVGQMVEDFPAVGGSSPNSVVATDQYVFVSNGNNDCVSVIDVKTNAVIKNIPLTPDARLGKLRGVIPFGLALSPDNRRLYVAESGINAVAVIDVPTLAVIGHLPSGWFPSKLKVTPDGKQLLIANAKGYGSGPNGGKSFQLSDRGSYIGSLMNGTVSVMTIPTDAELKAETEQVVRNNFTFRPVANVPATTNPIPAYAGQKRADGQNLIKHIVFIAKENRTYDEVLGQLPGGNGDSTLARYGVGITVTNRRANQTVEKAAVMPNHLALARRFAMSDNFYCDSDVSADGHRWLVNTYPNEWVETGTAAAYGGKRNLRDSSDAPGNLAFYGSAGSIYPEDYNEGGSMWEHLERWKKEFFNFGFGVEMAGAYSDSTMKYIGEKYTINYPLPAPLFDRTSRTFPTYNMAIPDQFRADLFMKEFTEKWGSASAGKKSLPDLLTLMLPNDHGTRPRPKAGFPFTESYMADNDLALGRVVEFLSQTPYWKNMLIVVLEDDPQGGVDHIDAHRSPLLVISPWVKRNYVGHVHYSFGSVFKTFWNILGMPCLNQYDTGATDLSDLFTDKPDFTPYRAVPSDLRLFDPQKALDPFDEKFDWKAFSESEELDRTETMQKRRAEDDEEAKRKAPAKKAKRKQ